MARLKIDYGIDLGTTNSAICRMEKGTPVIQKIEVTDDTMPSCVFFNRRGGTIVGASAYRSMKSDKRTATKSWKSDFNTYVEFKRSMGTDKVYHSSNMEKEGLKSDYTSPELSAEVLKTLKSFITDESFSSIVITVPARFTIPQKDATAKAAKLAGFDCCELLQEPLAACYAYGLSSEQKNGYWMVFDFGGGTFDAALVKVEDGIISVVDTEGDNFLGGKNLDFAIVDEIIIPNLQKRFSIEGIMADERKKEVLREAMKTYAEDLKNKLSFNQQDDILSNLGDLGCDDDGEELEVDLSVTQDEAFNVMRPLFQKAIDICKSILKRNGLSGSELNKLILVGGPTHSPLVRQMLKEQVTPNVDTSINPMTAVAMGAALYASTKDTIPPKEEEIQVGTIRLNIGYEATSVEQSEWVSVQLDKSATGQKCPEKVYVQFVNAQKTWSSGKVEVNEIGNVIEAHLTDGKANSFVIETYDEFGNSLECFPNEFTILQGTKTGGAPLPMHIGIEVWDEERQKLVFAPIEGLEKNKPLPATGILNSFKTTNQIRVGNATDRMVIPIYQATEYEKGKAMSSKVFEYAAEVVIDGTEDDLTACIPSGAFVDFTIIVDQSEHLTVEAFFPAQDITIKKEVKVMTHSRAEAKKQIKENAMEAQRLLNDLTNAGVDVSDLQMKLNENNKEGENNSETAQILEHQKEVMRAIEKRDIDTEYMRLEKELRTLFDMTEEDNKKYGNEQSTQVLEQLRIMVNEAIAKEDPKMAKEVLEQVRVLDMQLSMHEYFIAWIASWQNRFNIINWKDRAHAQKLINQAIPIIQNNPTTEKLHPYVQQLISLLPENEIPEGAGGRVKKSRG